MNKRIKTVWALSVVIIIMIFLGQLYWLYNQYTYSIATKVQTLKTVCAEVLKQDYTTRYDLMLRNKNTDRQTVLSLKCDSSGGANGKKIDKNNIYSTVTLTVGSFKKQVRLKGNVEANGHEITDRFMAERYIPLTKRRLDSLLADRGCDTTSTFKLYKTDTYMIYPQFAGGDALGGTLTVRFSTNPILYKAAVFTFRLRPSDVLSSMMWQMAGSAILFAVLCFCLWYIMRTIIFQKRIDNIRHEFMKNMIYEMKQPPAEEPADGDAMKLGGTQFFYSANELRHGTSKTIITSRQAEILRLLAQRMNEVVSREELLNEVWGDDSYSNSMALNVQISYLRRALKPDSTVSIEAVIKKGYKLKVISQ